MDSRVGAQLNARFSPQVSAIVQVTSEQRYDGTYRPEVEWANIKYDVTPDFSIRAGRTVLPSFMVSDYRKVGYATPWVRPPVEVYSLMPLTRSDGLDVSYRMQLGDFKNTIQATYGESNARLVGGGKVKGKNGRGISNTLEHGPATLRVSYFEADVTIEPYKQLFDGYRQVAQYPGLSQANAIANKYDGDNKPFSFISVGGSYDPGKWFVMGEWGVTDSRSAYGKREAWYAGGGYRIGKFTPYVNYSQVRLKSNRSDPGLTLPPGHPAEQLNIQLNTILAEAPDQKTISLGVRWDFVKNAALKLQYDHSNIGENSPGTLDHMLPSFEPGGKFNVISATIDFVF